MRTSSVRPSLLACLASLTACGFDWSLPVADGGGGAGGGGGLGSGGLSANGAGATDMTTGAQDTVTTGPQLDECEACVQSATTQRCGGEAQQCSATPGCTELALCASDCRADLACVDQCAAQSSDEAVLAFGALFECAVCFVCFEVCPAYQRFCT